MSAADSAFDAGTANKPSDGTSQRQISDEAPVACGNRHKPARAVYEGCHLRSSDFYRRRSRDFKVPGNAARNDFLRAWRAVTNWDVFGCVHCQTWFEGWRALWPARLAPLWFNPRPAA